MCVEKLCFLSTLPEILAVIALTLRRPAGMRELSRELLRQTRAVQWKNYITAGIVNQQKQIFSSRKQALRGVLHI